LEPDPVQAAVLAELGGADGITVHIRSDRRHINDRDVKLLAATVKTNLNLEMAATEEMLDIARDCGPDNVTLVPERPEEITTEGGLDVTGAPQQLAEAVTALLEMDITVSVFLDPNPAQIDAVAEIGAHQIEINTAAYADVSETRKLGPTEVERVKVADVARRAHAAGLRVAAGHGLTYRNVRGIVDIPEIIELNIGHNIVARATSVGLEAAVREMKARLIR
jgi:pyridoxine 5-phosphate synthase